MLLRGTLVNSQQKDTEIQRGEMSAKAGQLCILTEHFYMLKVWSILPDENKNLVKLSSCVALTLQLYMKHSNNYRQPKLTILLVNNKKVCGPITQVLKL